MISFEEISKEQGFKVNELQQGYALFWVDEGVEAIQTIDCLQDYGLERFKSDTEAGKQALKDGYKLFTVEHEDLAGWYILDTPENRRKLFNKGYMTIEEFGA